MNSVDKLAELRELAKAAGFDERQYHIGRRYRGEEPYIPANQWHSLVWHPGWLSTLVVEKSVEKLMVQLAKEKYRGNDVIGYLYDFVKKERHAMEQSKNPGSTEGN